MIYIVTKSEYVKGSFTTRELAEDCVVKAERRYTDMSGSEWWCDGSDSRTRFYCRNPRTDRFNKSSYVITETDPDTRVF